MKYRIKDFANQTLTLPVDINAPVEKAITERFSEPVLASEIQRWRERRLFGDLNYLQKDGLMGCSLSFQGGICIRYWLIKRDSLAKGNIEGKWSILNENIDLKDNKNS